MNIGPLMIDLKGTTITQDEIELIQHPLVGGIIFFSRNYESREQITELASSIRKAKPNILIAVDQEGGRVQRFKEGFTPLPPMGRLGELYLENPNYTSLLAEKTGWLMAVELLTVGIDFSFAPVLDLNKEMNSVIGDRSFSSSPTTIIHLAKHFIRGMKRAGMSSIGKHFPGHGHVTLDSHTDLPIDTRAFETIESDDLQPFKALIQDNIPALMTAHIIFSSVDEKPVTFSTYWLRDLLRDRLHFKGFIFSDDLNMEGAACIGNHAIRAESALQAGCDMVLLCNNRRGVEETLDRLNTETNFSLSQMSGKMTLSWNKLKNHAEYQETKKMISNEIERL